MQELVRHPVAWHTDWVLIMSFDANTRVFHQASAWHSFFHLSWCACFHFHPPSLPLGTHNTLHCLIVSVSIHSTAAPGIHTSLNIAFMHLFKKDFFSFLQTSRTAQVVKRRGRVIFSALLYPLIFQLSLKHWQMSSSLYCRSMDKPSSHCAEMFAYPLDSVSLMDVVFQVQQQVTSWWVLLFSEQPSSTSTPPHQLI